MEKSLIRLLTVLDKKRAADASILHDQYYCYTGNIWSVIRKYRYISTKIP